MSESPPPIPVVCDICRAEGAAGEDPFAAIADLLTFDPVERRAHVNNWTAEHQRAFIAALAITGSPRQAARALGRHAFGADQLRSAKGGRSFAQAWDHALELYRERELFRIRENLAGLAEQQEARDEVSLAQSHLRALPPRLAGSYPDRGGEPLGEDGAVEGSPADSTVDPLLAKYLLKLDCERKARRAGNIIAADFYLRQLTWIEVAIDIACAGGAVDALAKVRLKSAGGDWSCGLIDVAETEASRLLDDLRRAYWSEQGEPERPPQPPEESFQSHDMIAPDGRSLTVRTQPSWIMGGPDLAEREASRRADRERWASEYIAYEQRALAEQRESTEAKPNDGGTKSTEGQPDASAWPRDA